MFPLSRFKSLSLVVVSLVAGLAAARTPDALAPRVRLSVFNDAGIPVDTLAQAAARATAILAQSGVELAWLDCGRPDPADFSPPTTPCSVVAWPHQLSVRILPRARSVGADIFGQAFLDDAGRGAYSNVYYNNLAANREHTQLSDGDMLGFVIAHEVGHLLLGSNSHSPSGLMQPRWDSSALHSASRNTLFFTPAQSATLRARLSESLHALPAASPLYSHVMTNLQIRSFWFEPVEPWL